MRYPRPLFRLLEGCNYITSSLPGIVTALALVTVTIHYARPVYQTEVTLFLAYLLMFMPRALINLRAGIAQAPVELENVARSLGRSPARALWSITMRLAAPGAAAGAALVFLGVSNELTATLLLSPLGTRTLSTGFWALTSEIDYVAAAPYALLMIVISLPLTAVLYMQSKKWQGCNMLELSSISKSFADALVLDNLNLTVAPGSRTAIVGPSGSGKPRCCAFSPVLKRPIAGGSLCTVSLCLPTVCLSPPTSDGSAMFRRKGRCFLILMLRTISPGARRQP